MVANRSGSAGFRNLALKAPSPKTRFRLESFGLFAAACLFILTSHLGNWFSSLDQLIYDAVIARTQAPQALEIVLVGIDDIHSTQSC